MSKPIKLSVETANVFAGSMADALAEWVEACRSGEMPKIAEASAKLTGVANAARDFFALIFGMSTTGDRLEHGANLAQEADTAVKRQLKAIPGQSPELAEPVKISKTETPAAVPTAPFNTKLFN